MPATKKLMELMRKEGPEDEVEDSYHEPAMAEDDYNQKLLQIRLKRKYQLGMIKKMLEEGGYGDLAKMTNVGKKSYDPEE